MMRNVALLFSLIFSVLARADETVHVSAAVSPEQASPGETVTLKVDVAIPPGFHIYGLSPPDMSGIPATIDLEDSSSFVPQGEPTEPTPDLHYDEIFEVDVPWHKGEVSFTLPLQISTSLPGGRTEIAGRFGYQLCDERSCRIPTDVPFSASVVIEGDTISSPDQPDNAVIPAVTLELPSLTAPEPVSDTAAPGEGSAVRVIAKYVGYDPSEEKFLAFLRSGESREQTTQAKGLWAFIGAAIAAGFLSILTPCVFPMIPITVSFFSNMAGGNRRETVGLAALYSGGIIFTYTAIGVLFSVLLGAGGIQNVASSPVMNLVLAAVLIFFTLNLLGMFEIRISTGGVGAGQREGRGGKVISVLLMALAFSLASFTCTAGFVGALLVAAAQGDVFWPLLGMLVYSLSFATPFFFLALFPSWLASLPQSGGWMNRIKVTMGILIFAACFKFLSNVDAVWELNMLSREAVLTIWVAAFFLLGFYLLGKIRFPHDDPEPGPVSVPRFLFAVLIFAFSVHLVFGLGGKDLWAPLNGLLPAPTHEAGVLAEEWPEDYDAAVDHARRQNKMVFVDFTGYTCTNCKLMEHKVLSRPAVQSELKRFVPVRLYTDGGPDKKRNQDLAKDLAGSLALPLYVILEPVA
jgi:thiol:disulfide interchange protein DsbD